MKEHIAVVGMVYDVNSEQYLPKDLTVSIETEGKDISLSISNGARRFTVDPRDIQEFVDYLFFRANSREYHNLKCRLTYLKEQCDRTQQKRGRKKRNENA